MKYNIEIEYPKDINISAVCPKIMMQVLGYAHESKLLENTPTCSGIRIIINPNLEKFSEVKEINSKMYWAFGSSNMEILGSVLKNFQLRCLHLELNGLGEKCKILLVLLPIKDNSDTKEADTNENLNDNVTSYVATDPCFTLQNVIMPQETKDQINRSISLINNRKKIYIDWGFKEIDPHTKAILCFWGPPGTGKTMCAHALANELHQKILIASYASIESKWVGEGPKNLRKIFKDAKEQNAVLFFDEADSFLSKRVNNAETGSDKHYNRMSNEMFQLLEDYDGIIIFATNLVSDFDKAFKSRILSFIEFTMPDFENRINLIKSMIPKQAPIESPLTQEHFNHLSQLSESFSGREIRKAILTSLAEAATHDADILTFDYFKEGFISIKHENDAVNKEIEAEKSPACIKDFLEEMKINNSIIDVCLKVIFQDDEINERTKNHLFLICKLLNSDFPDLSVSYQNKDISSSIPLIIDSGRKNECLRFVSELVSLMNINEDKQIEVLSNLLNEFKETDQTLYVEYFKSYKKIN